MGLVGALAMVVGFILAIGLFAKFMGNKSKRKRR